MKKMYVLFILNGEINKMKIIKKQQWKIKLITTFNTDYANSGRKQAESYK